MLTILLATYNGGKHLPAQLDSLLAQTYTNFQIHILDDASTDRTWHILQEYRASHPNKINIARNETNSGSAMNNFFKLITTVKDKYVMLCDQDDIWMPDKIETTMIKMRELERANPWTPVLVHTDLAVVDENLNIIHPSYRELTKRDYAKKDLRQILTINNASGCTLMYNQKLAELITQVPKTCLMHDWWLKLVATLFGVVGHVETSTILYRQHGRNACGAKDVGKFGYKLQRLFNHKELKETLHNTCKQAGCLLEIYGSRLTDEQRHLLTEYAQIPSRSKLGRIITLKRLGISMPGLSRNMALILFI